MGPNVEVVNSFQSLSSAVPTVLSILCVFLLKCLKSLSCYSVRRTGVQFGNCWSKAKPPSGERAGVKEKVCFSPGLSLCVECAKSWLSPLCKMEWLKPPCRVIKRNKLDNVYQSICKGLAL